VTSPDREVVRGTHGYHPLTSDLEEILRNGGFDQLLVFGPGVNDVAEQVHEIRIVTQPPVQLPQGVYWFSGAEPSGVLSVTSGASPGPSITVPLDSVPEGSALDNTLRWLDQTWETATVVPEPLFSVGDDVIVGSTGQDGIVRSGRRYVAGQWLYNIFSGGQTARWNEQALSARLTADDAAAWIVQVPVSPKRFAATLSRAKLQGQFTDTIFSFRATRTIFRPYQFKPVQKLLDTGTLRLLMADEVGLGKTIEAGLVWTEMEARRQADRVLVVCPSMLVGKWRREMEDRFGFLLTELDASGLDDLLDRLESDRLPRRAAYISSIERLRMWGGLQRATELGLQFDLSIVDEAHYFRNSDTKSYGLGEQLQDWSDALVMLSATPINLRNRDLFNLLSLLVPGEFEDVESLERRLAPNAVLNRLTKSLIDPRVTNADRLRWLKDFEDDPFGFVIALRPDFKVLRDVLSTENLDAAGAVMVKRICAELHGLSAQVTRTRKVDVQEEKPLREPHRIPVLFDEQEAEFYGAYYQWCAERAKLSGAAINFAMQMPLRLAGSCLPEAARYVLEWGRSDDLEAEDIVAVPKVTKAANQPPDSHLVALAEQLDGDTKFGQLQIALADLVRQGKRVIVFTFSRRTLRYLQGRLGQSFRIGVLHGGVPSRNRGRIMADFRSGAFEILLASRVASEGLDFEFCSAVVNYDLPWNPMEVEQRIGRIDRIGQVEKKIGVLNFHTPGTIETDIIERVMERIGVFEHAIGELEPILEAEWKSVESLLFDFSLDPEQKRLRTEQMIQAIEMRAKDLEFVESAAPVLISSDTADIEGLERDLLASGRYVGQAELAVLIQDWTETFGGAVARNGSVLELRGNEELAGHVQTLVRTGERLASEVEETCALLRSEQIIYLSLDQEMSRTTGLPLLTAMHPLTRAALGTPGYRQGRFTLLEMDPGTAGLPEGTYLSLLAVVSWNGIRPLHEVWSSSINLVDLSDAGDSLGLAIMKDLAEASYRAAPMREHSGLVEAVDLATMNLEVRVANRRSELIQENDAFIATRRLSFEDVHERRLQQMHALRRTHMERGNRRALRLTEARIAKEQNRFASQIAALDVAHAPSLTTDDLAVCVVEVRG
jgi:Helicase conserved C-terminal domain/SNF2-related domain